MSEQRIRVIVIDDHPLVHQGVAAVAALHEDLEFAGAAATTDEGLRLLAQQPDVAVVDLRLSGSSGLNLIEEGRRTAPGCRFVLLSSMLNPAAVRRAMELGVTAVLSKEAPPEDMVTAIRRAAQGRPYVDPSVMDV
ncbi:MAG: DNA-binding response regulator, partial [Bacillota bacterium]